MQAYVSFREDEHNDCDETKYEIQINLYKEVTFKGT